MNAREEKNAVTPTPCRVFWKKHLGGAMILGIDIGGTAVKMAAVNEKNEIIDQLKLSTPRESAEALLEAITEAALKLHAVHHFESVGIGTPGDVDVKRGICIKAGNLPYCNTPLGELLSRALGGIPVSVVNDATCAVYGELYAGLGKKYKNFVMLTLGTGVGGGIVIGGSPYLGSHGMAGEIGVMTVREGDGNGSYERFASVTALIRETRAATEAHPDSLLANVSGSGVSGRTAFDAARQGCPVAEEVIRKYARAVALGIRNVAKIFDPDAIVLGGAITNEGDALLTPVRDALGIDVTVEISPLRNGAGIIGAAIVARLGGVSLS